MTSASLAAWGAAVGTFLLGTKELWAMFQRWTNRKHFRATEEAALEHQHALNDKVSVDAAALAVVTATGLLDAVKRELDDARDELRDTRQECERLVAQAREEIAKLGKENAQLQVALNECLSARAREGEPSNGI